MKYESSILKRLIDTYGVIGNPRYLSEIIKEFIVRGKELYPQLFTYQSDWLAHIDEFGLTPEYTVSYTGQHIYAPNTKEKPVKRAILKGSTKYRDIDTGEILETFEDGRNLELVSVRMPVLTTFNQQNLFYQYTKDDSYWGKDFSGATTSLIYNQNGGTVKFVSKGGFSVSGFHSNALPLATYKFSCKIKVGKIGDQYRIVFHENPNNTTNNNRGFATSVITSTKEVEAFEYVGYFQNADNALFYGFYNGQEIEYYDIMLTKLSDSDIVEDYKKNPQKYEYKTNILTVNEDVTLRSNGSVYDELDLLTGKLTQRIDENGEVLSQEIVKTVDVTILDQNGQNVKQLMSFNGGTQFNTGSLEGSLLPTVTVDVVTDLEETLLVCSLEGNTM